MVIDIIDKDKNLIGGYFTVKNNKDMFIELLQLLMEEDEYRIWYRSENKAVLMEKEICL
jgi:hypothetical protein